MKLSARNVGARQVRLSDVDARVQNGIWTAPEDIKHWNAVSDDWHTTAATVDLRVGGAFCSRMEAKDGSMGFDFAGTYTRIEEQRLIECSFGGADSAGRV